jgi:hypothetical protein
VTGAGNLYTYDTNLNNGTAYAPTATQTSSNTSNQLAALISATTGTSNLIVNGGETIAGTNSTTDFQVQNATGTSVFNVDTTNNRVGVNVTASQLSAPTGLTLGQSATVGTLTTADTYKYEITAIDSNGGQTTPSTEASYTLSAGDTTITLYWTAVAGASGYDIYRTAANGASGSETYLTTVTSNYSSSTPYSDSGSITLGTTTPPTINTSYYSTNNANNNLQLVVGGNGTPTGQVYVSGTVPTSAVGSVITGTGTPVSVYVQGHYAYVLSQTTNTLKVVDVSTPAAPSTIGSVTIGGTPQSVYVQGRYAYIANDESNGFQIVDVSNPANPVLLESFNDGSDPYAIYVSGQYAYVLNVNNTFQAINVSNPYAPTVVGSVTTGTTPYSLFVSGRYAYVVTETSDTLQIIDISNPSTPTIVGSVGIGSTATSVFVSGRYAYVTANGVPSLQVIDVSNPTDPIVVGNVTTASHPISVYVQGRYAYVVSTSGHSLQVIDVSNPSAPTVDGSLNTGYLLYSIFVSGRYAYVTIGGIDSLQIFDLGGEYAQQLQAGGAEVGTLTVDTNAQVNGDQTIAGGLSVGGSAQIGGSIGSDGLTITGLATPGTPTLATVGTAGTTTYGYAVSAFNVGSSTPPSTAALITTGNATLSSLNFNKITIATVTGATGYNVYRTFGGGTTGLLGTINPATTSTITPTSLAVTGGSSPYTATATFSSMLPYAVGQLITTSGVTCSAGSFTNGTYPITAITPSSNTITFAVNTSCTVNAVGTITGVVGMGDIGNATLSSVVPTVVNNINNVFNIQTGSNSDVLTANASTGQVGIDVTATNLSAPTGLYVSTTGSAAGDSLGTATYYYKVTAIDSNGGETTPSAETSHTFASGTTNYVTLGWNPVAGASGYRVYRGTAAGAESVYYTTLGSINVATVYFTDTGSSNTVTATPPTVNTSYYSSNTSTTNNNLQLVVGGNGTPTGQVYISGTVPSSAVGNLYTGSGSRPQDVVVQGKYAYIVDTGTSTLQIADVSNPANPVSLSTITTQSNPIALSVVGQYVYVVNAGASSLQIFDVSNPSSPELVSTATTGVSSPYYIYVQGSYAYVLNNGSSTIETYNISDPANPVAVSSVSTVITTSETGPFAITVEGHYAYVINSNGSNSYLAIFDLTNPTLPVAVGNLLVGNDPNGIYVSGRYAYIDNWNTPNLQIVDVSNPTSPVSVSTISDGGGPTAISVSGRYAYVDNINSSTLQIIDVSNPDGPQTVGTIPLIAGSNSYSDAVYVSGRYAYVTNNTSNYLQIFDLGGAYIQQLQAGGAELGSLTVDTNAQINGDQDITGGLNVGGSADIADNLGVQGSALFNGNVTIAPTLSTSVPATPSEVQVGGANNSKTYDYAVTAIDANGGTTLPSPSTNFTSGGTTLSTTVYESVTWAPVSGASSYGVYRTSANGTPSTTGLVATVAVSSQTAQTASSVAFSTPTVTFTLPSTPTEVVGQAVSVTSCSGTAADNGANLQVTAVNAGAKTIGVYNTSGVAGETGCVVTGLLGVDDSNLTAGSAAPTAASFGSSALAFENATNANTVSITTGVPSSSYTLTLPNTAPTTGLCLQTSTTSASQLTFSSCANTNASITYVGASSNNGSTNVTSATDTQTWANVGDLVTVAVQLKNASSSVSSISNTTGPGVVSWQSSAAVVSAGNGTVNRTELWYGTVTTAGSETFTVNFSGSGTSTSWEVAATEFTAAGVSASSTWGVDTKGSLLNSSASTNITYPSLTSEGSGEVYFGYGQSQNLTGSAGSAGGANTNFSFMTTTQGNEIAYNTQTSAATSYQPVATQTSGESNTVAAIFTAFVTSTSINNSLTTQQANFNVQAASSGSVAGVLQANAAGSGDILDLLNGSGIKEITVSNNGTTVIGNSATITQYQEVDTHGTNQATQAITPNAIGDLETVAVECATTGVTVTGVSGGDVTTWNLVTHNTSGVSIAYLYQGVVTSTGAGTITASYSGTPGATCELAAEEFASNIGSSTIWSVNATSAATGSSGTAITFPSENATQNGQMYLGYAALPSTGIVGSTTGFAYKVTGAGNLFTYDMNLASGSAYQPTATQTSSNTANQLAALISATSGTSSLTVNGGETVGGTTSATAFQVQNATGGNVLSVNTSTNTAVLGTSNSVSGSLMFDNSTNSNTVTLNAGTPSSSYSLSLPTGAPTTGLCLETSTASASQLIFSSCANANASITEVGTSSNSGTTNVTSATDSQTWSTVGDLVTVSVQLKTATSFVSSISNTTGPGVVSWQSVATKTQAGDSTIDRTELWYGTVTTAGSETFTVNISGGTGVAGGAYPSWEIVGTEFTAVGISATSTWSVDATGSSYNSSSSTTVQYPNITSEGADELYVGYATTQYAASAGSAGGVNTNFSFNTSTSTYGLTTYNTTTAAATAYDPQGTQGTAGESNTVGAIFKAFVSSTSINNSTSVQEANFDVQAATSGSVAGVLQANAAGSADILDLLNATGTKEFTVGSTGNTTIGDSSTINQVQEVDAHATNEASITSFTPSAVGDLEVLAVECAVDPATPLTITQVIGGGVTNWYQVTSNYSNVTSNSSAFIWEGTTTSTSAAAITITYSATPGATCEMAAQEFSAVSATSTVWSVTAKGGGATTAGTSFNYPSLTATQYGELYWGYAATPGTAQACTTSPVPTPGFSYKVTGNSQLITYDTGLSATASANPYAPNGCITTSNVTNDVAMIITASTGSNLTDNGGANFTGTSSASDFQVQNATSTSVFDVDTLNNRVGIDVTFTALASPTGLTVASTGSATGDALGSNDYYYKVTAIDGGEGETVPSSEVNHQFTSGTTNYVTLTWTAVAGATGYRIYRSNCTGTCSTGGGKETYMATATGTTYTDIGNLTPNSTYPPSSGNAYSSADTTNNNLQLTVGGNGTPEGQLYVGGTVPTGAIGTATISGSAEPYGIAVQGNYAYVSFNVTNTLDVFDISNPADPVLLGSTSTLAEPYYVQVQGKYVYVADGTGNALQIYDVSNPYAPVLVSNFTSNVSDAASVFVAGDYAYITNNGGGAYGLEIINISNPATPTLAGNIAAGSSPWNVYVQGRYAYVIDGSSNKNMYVIDVSNPSTPILDATYTVSGSAGTDHAVSGFNNIYVQGSYAYIAASTEYVDIINIANPSNPTFASLFTTANGTSNVSSGVFLSGHIAYVIETNSSNDGYMQAVNVTNPYNPTAIGNSIVTGNNPQNLFVQGRYVYVDDNSATTLSIFDVGGEYTSSIQAGAAEVGTLGVDSNALINGYESVAGGIQDGASAQIAGNLGVAGASNFESILTVTGGPTAAPGAPTVTPTCSGTCGTTYDYKVAATNGSGLTTAASGAGATAAGNATLSAATGEYNTVTWTAVAGAYGYDIYRTTGGASQGLVGFTTGTTFIDDGYTANGTAPATNSVTTAFQVQTSANNNLVSVDTTGDNVYIGSTVSEAQASQVFIANSSAAVQQVTIGSTDSTSSVLVQSGTGNIELVGGAYTNADSGVIIGTGSTTSTPILFQLNNSTLQGAETAGNCTTTVNSGALYYSTSTASSNTTTNEVRGCINGKWMDVVTADQLGLDLLGVDETSGTNAGDISGITGYTNSPCKVTWATSASVTVAPCVAYSGGRKVVITAATTVTTAGTGGSVTYQHICLNGTNGAPTATAANTSETAGVPAFSAAAPILCLATVKLSNAATPAITNIYDTRVFVSTVKEYVTAAAAVAPGFIVTVDTVNGANTVITTTTAAQAGVIGVIAVGSPSSSTTTINAIVSLNGPAFVKVTGSMTLGQAAQTSTTAGYAQSAASAGGYKDLGQIMDVGSTAACSAATNCQFSALIYVEPH